MIINENGHDSKVLEPCDKVKCKGITCTIAEITFDEIIKSDCGQCFGGYGGDSACDTCEFSERCKVLTNDLDAQ